MQRYSPEQWFGEPLDVDRSGEWNLVRRYGNMVFLYDQRARAQFNQLRGTNADAVLWLKPSEASGAGETVTLFRDPRGNESLRVVRPEPLP